MSTFRVPVIRIGKIGKHPNADTLSITQAEGCPVIFRTGDFQEGDLAIYVPVDAVVPETVPGTEFLKSRRIKAMRLRGIFSMGLLLPMSAWLGRPDHNTGTWNVGDDVSAELGITKYEEVIPVHMQSEMAPAPKTLHSPPVYDMESYRKYKNLLVLGEEVVVTEKIHGTNSRFVVTHEGMHCGSHNSWKKENKDNLWWRVADTYNLKPILAQHPGFIFYGETYGQVQDLKYGTKKGELKLAIFDIFDSNTGRWLNHDQVAHLCLVHALPMVPVLYKGPYVPSEVEPLCDGKTWVTNVEQIREGFVIKPVVERWNPETTRTIFKLVGEEYLTRKGGTELH